MRDFGEMVADAEAMKHFGRPWWCGTSTPASRSRCSRCPARRSRSAGPGAAPQLRLHRDGADLEDLARREDDDGDVAGEGGRRHRRSEEDAAAGRHQPLGRRPTASSSTPSWTATCARLRRLRSAQAEADPRAEDRRAGEHGVADLGREARSTSRRRCSRTGTRQGADNEQFLKAYAWDGKELAPRFEIDFRPRSSGGRT